MEALALGTTGTAVVSAANLVNTGVQVVNQNTSGDAGMDKGAQKVITATSTLATVAGTIAVAANAVPLVGQVIAVVAAIIVGIATIIGKNKAKIAQMTAERMQWEKINAELLNQNAQLDAEIVKLRNAIDNMAKALGIKIGNGGLGLCIFNCKKKEAEKLLNNAKDLNADLVKEQDEKIELITELAKLAESMVVTKNTRYIGWAIGLVALVVGGIVYFKN